MKGEYKLSIEQLRKELEEIKQELQGPQVVGHFEKVSFEQFLKDFNGDGKLTEEEVLKVYEDILVLPKRSSVDSAGHDFVLTKDITLKPGESVEILTGIRSKIKKGWVLLLAPRSGLGSKFRLQINNTIGVIDGDYYEAENEGHIKATITNDSNENKTLELKTGDRFIQGFFVPYGITEGDNVTAKRTGGYGSSGLSSIKTDKEPEQLTLF